MKKRPPVARKRSSVKQTRHCDLSRDNPDVLPQGARVCLRISFGEGGNAEDYQVSGWSSPEQGFTWAVGSTSILTLPPFEAEANFTILLRGYPFRLPRRLEKLRGVKREYLQVISTFLNGDFIDHTEVFGQSTFLLELGCGSLSNPASELKFTYADPVTPESWGLGDTRNLAFAWQSIKIIATPTRRRAGVSGSPAALDATSQRLETWAKREMLHWVTATATRTHTRRSCEVLNHTMPWAAVFDIHGGHVRLAPKPTTLPDYTVLLNRATEYLVFLQAVARRLPPDCVGTICVSTADMIEGCYEVPVFVFQKFPGDETVLVPDIEFIQYDFYEDELFHDRRAYLEKTSTAVFAGATTGCEITEEVVRSLANPRLKAATYFENNILVDFRLPDIVQCSSEKVFAMLQEKSFCNRPRLTWDEQFRHRFLISIDGNGATCSRVAIGLLSNSVLVKYRSNRALYYSAGLVAGLHYVDVSANYEIDRILATDRQDVTYYQAIAEAGRAFASEYLTRIRAEEYMAILLTMYFRSLRD